VIRPLALALVALLTGCQRDSSDPPAVRDSAGIRIVENRRPTWSSDEAWRLDTAPTLDIGSDELSRIGQAIRLKDGRIIVAHDGAHEILIYSPRGELLRRFGRRGRGPGEFLEISQLLIIGGDSILVWDLNQNRISVFDTEGALARTEPVSLERTQMLVQGVFDDGSLLIATPNPPDENARGLVRPMRALSRRMAHGEVRELLRLPGMEMFYQQLPTGELDFRPPFFGHTSHTAVRKDRLVWAATDSFELHVHSADGKPLLIIEKEHPIRQVTAADVEPLIEQRVAAIRDEAWRPTVRRMLSALPTGTLPAFGAAPGNGPPLIVDDDHNIWVAEFTMPGEHRNRRLVFDSIGVWLGTVELPQRFAPRHIGSDFILGKALDSLDVEHVRLYALRKPR
jgi:hypothetical protein